MRILSFGKSIITNTLGKLSRENCITSALLLESNMPANNKSGIPPAVINKPHTLRLQRDVNTRNLGSSSAMTHMWADYKTGQLEQLQELLLFALCGKHVFEHVQVCKCVCAHQGFPGKELSSWGGERIIEWKKMQWTIWEIWTPVLRTSSCLWTEMVQPRDPSVHLSTSFPLVQSGHPWFFCCTDSNPSDYSHLHLSLALSFRNNFGACVLFHSRNIPYALLHLHTKICIFLSHPHLDMIYNVNILIL